MVLTALAVVLLAALLIVVTAKSGGRVRAYAEFTTFKSGCRVDAPHSLNAIDCIATPRGAFVVRFSARLDESVVVASRGSCCPGPIAASISDAHSVTVTLGPGPSRVVDATVLVP